MYITTPSIQHQNMVHWPRSQTLLWWVHGFAWQTKFDLVGCNIPSHSCLQWADTNLPHNECFMDLLTSLHESMWSCCSRIHITCSHAAEDWSAIWVLLHQWNILQWHQTSMGHWLQQVGRNVVLSALCLSVRAWIFLTLSHVGLLTCVTIITAS